MYRGSIYVNALTPIDQEHTEWGFSKFRHVYPFEFGFRQRLTALVGVPTEQALRVFIREAKVDTAGTMLLTVETHYANDEGLESPSVSPALTVGTHDGLCTGASGLCIQEWHYSKAAWANSDNIAYQFNWVVHIDQHQVGVQITIKQQLQETQSETGLDIGQLKLRVFASEANLVAGANEVVYGSKIFDPRERVFIRADLVVPPVDANNFELDVKNVWVCYSEIEGYNIEYIEGQKLGCLDDFILSSERFQIMTEGANTSGEFTLNTHKDRAWAAPAGKASDGFSYLATPQLPSGRTYTIHVEADVTQVAQNSLPAAPKQQAIAAVDSATNEYRRSVHFVTQGHRLRAEDANQGAASTLTFRLAERSSADNANSGFSLVTGVVIGLCALAGCSVLVAAFFMIRRYRRNQVDYVNNDSLVINQDA